MIGPLARRYYFRSAKLVAEQRAERAYLFGGCREGLRPLKPYQWEVGADRLLEIPVTTMPCARLPIHVSYVLYLAGPLAGAGPPATSPTPCGSAGSAGVEPSILLHPLDFLGADDVDELGFFPGMGMTGAAQAAGRPTLPRGLAERFDVVPMGEHAAAIKGRPKLDVVSSSRAEPAASARPPEPVRP